PATLWERPWPRLHRLIAAMAAPTRLCRSPSVARMLFSCRRRFMQPCIRAQHRADEPAGDVGAQEGAVVFAYQPLPARAVGVEGERVRARVARDREPERVDVGDLRRGDGAYTAGLAPLQEHVHAI